jgi:hypothetical protein
MKNFTSLGAKSFFMFHEMFLYLKKTAENYNASIQNITARCVLYSKCKVLVYSFLVHVKAKWILVEGIKGEKEKVLFDMRSENPGSKYVIRMFVCYKTFMRVWAGAV